MALDYKKSIVNLESSNVRINSNSVKSLEDSSAKSPFSKLLGFSPYCNSKKRMTLDSIYTSKQLLKIRSKASSSKIKALEDKLTTQLEELAMREPVTRERLRIYKSSLDDIIAMNSSLSPMLKKIGTAYEQFFSLQEAEVTDKTRMVTELNTKLGEEQKLNKQLKKRFKRLMRDNVEMTGTLKDYEAQIGDLKRELSQNPESPQSQLQVRNLN